MAYRVRSEGGEVKFQSLYDVQRGIAVGLVSPTDELAEDGTENWRRINTILALKDARPEPSGGMDTGRWVIPVAAISAVALVLLFTERFRYWGLGLAVLLALGLSQVTFKVFQKRRVR
ncbi:MAG TPA: hypothetical protein VIG99_01550 [Myxococcaceae bacterium]|jgi:hypothetical protein